MKKFSIFVLFILILSGTGNASEIIDIRSLTDQILIIHLDDGYVIQPGYGQQRDESKIFVNPLNTEAASDPDLYTISSLEDDNYKIKKHPEWIGRKTKATEFTRIWPPIQPYANEHLIYLKLPYKMKRGKKYRIEVSVPLKGKKKFDFVFDEFRNRSDAIHVNQVGYIPGNSAKRSYQHSKYAYVSHWMGDKGPLDLDEYENRLFYIVEKKTGMPVFVNKIKKRKDFETGDPETKYAEGTPGGQYHASDVFECDFSSCQKADGEVYLVIEGIGCSYPFLMKDDVYREAFRTVCRGLYLERAGIDKLQPYSKWNHKADHNGAKGYPLYYTKYRYMDSKSEGGDRKKAEEMETGLIETWGWYHDAGDWDGYPTHMVVPAYLMTTWQFAMDNFKDDELNIPESGNGIPDILDEASWLLKYFQRTRHIAMDKNYSTGGVPGSRVHGDFYSKDKTSPSWEDKRKWYVFGEESLASFRYAGLSAQLAVCLSAAGFPDSAAIWEKEAEEVYNWALENTLKGDRIENARFFASAWLYRLFGDQKYLDQLLRDKKDFSRDLLFNDRNYYSWGVYACAGMPENPEISGLKKEMMSLAVWWADSLNIIPGQKRAFRYGISWGHPMVVGQATTPKVFPALVAHALTGEKKYWECLLSTSDYMLGGNPLNMCWVTGLGEHSPKEILHIDSWLDGVDEPIEGQVPYGPVWSGNRGGTGFNGPWDGDFLRAIVYPDETLWPGHELWSENRWCPITNEYTIHQNICVAAAIYGYLCDEY